MNLKTKLAAAAIMLGSVSMTQASTYNVEGVFYEPTAALGNTVFTGTFDWNGTTLSNFSGQMNSSMFYSSTDPLHQMSLNQNMITNTTGNIVTSSIFLNPSSVVFMGGGYDATVPTIPAMVGIMDTRGMAPNPNPANAYFTFSFDTTGGAVTPYGLTTSMQYGDCTSNGMMGSMCMTGFGPQTGVHGNGNPMGQGTMMAFAQSLTITPSAVPVPAAVWLFGSALTGMIGVSRRKRALVA